MGARLEMLLTPPSTYCRGSEREAAAEPKTRLRVSSTVPNFDALTGHEKVRSQGKEGDEQEDFKQQQRGKTVRSLSPTVVNLGAVTRVREGFGGYTIVCWRLVPAAGTP